MVRGLAVPKTFRGFVFTEPRNEEGENNVFPIQVSMQLFLFVFLLLLLFLAVIIVIRGYKSM